MYVLAAVGLLLVRCGEGEGQKEESHSEIALPTISKVWETPQSLRVPESVFYDSIDDVIYVANINGHPLDKDNNGFISRLSTSGDILDLKWVEGLHAPKGMGIFDGRLYVSDIDQVVKIDIDAARILNRYEAEGAEFLNDIAIDKSGVVYISDMSKNRIYRLKDNQVDIWLELDQKGPNGLYVENDRLLIGTSESIIAANLADGVVRTFVENTCSIDGLVPDGKGNYIISDWTGRTYLVRPGAKHVVLLDTGPSGMNAADIEFVIPKRLLLIPTFFDNRVVAYELR